MKSIVMTFALLLGVTLFSSSSFAGSCCSSGCPEIMPCPPSEPIARDTCDRSIHVYEIEGVLEFWMEFMRVERSCEYQPWQFEAMIFDQESFFSEEDKEFKKMKKIILQPWWAWSIDTTKSIANHPRWLN